MERKMNPTVLFIIFYILIFSYVLTGILTKSWKTVIFGILIGIIGALLARATRETKERI